MKMTNEINFTENNYSVSKTPPSNFLNNSSVKNEPIWVILCTQNPEEILNKQFCLCQPHVQNEATVPWKLKVIFQQ